MNLAKLLICVKLIVIELNSVIKIKKEERNVLLFLFYYLNFK